MHDKTKQIVSICALIVLVALVFVLARGASSSGGAYVEVAEGAEVIFTPGEYTGTGDGFGGSVETTITVSEYAITDVSIDAAMETAEIGQAAAPLLADQVLEAQSPDIDGVTGASLTSDAVRKGVESAMKEAGRKGTAASASSSDASETAEAEPEKQTETVSETSGAPQIVYLSVEAPVPAAENGVVTADEWREVYPEIVASYEANDRNTYRVDYNEENPFMKEFYEGFGFAKDYTSAVGHVYTLDDVSHTERPHPMANCLTCKTPDFTKLVNDMGEEAYKLDFEETFAQMSQSISCYNCHANDAGNGGERVITHQYLANAVAKESKEISKDILVCGQCHSEYYFYPDTKATTLPYEDIAGMDPEAILAFYDSMEFADWTQESTGTKLLKTQHPEMETFLGEGSKHKDLLTCADCHMATTVSEDGKAYTSHMWESPLNNELILETCVKCHKDTDMEEYVHAVQAEVTARETEVGEKLAAMKNKLAEANADGSKTEEELEAIRKLHRSAQWYWDFSFVENSEGAHNSTMSKRCLDLSESLIDEAMELLK